MKFNQYLTEEKLYESISYELYSASLEYLFTEEYTDDGLNEGIKDFLAGIKDKSLQKVQLIFKTIKGDLSKLADEIGADAKEVLKSFKSKNMFGLLKMFKFSIKSIFKSVTTLSGLVRKGLFDVFKKIHDSGALKKIQKGAMKVDDLLEQYPILNKVGGVAVAGLIFFMWTQMTFIGDLDYDFDFTTIKEALQGKYSIADIFTSPQGLMFISLFATGGLISVPWMGTTIGNLVIALVYTGYKHIKNSDGSIENKLKSKMRVI